MAESTPRHRDRLCASRSTTARIAAGPLSHRASRHLCLVILACTSLAYGIGPVGSLAPPPPPGVPPVISRTYPTDLNDNQIDDALERDMASKGKLSIASSSQDQMVNVELVFQNTMSVAD